MRILCEVNQAECLRHGIDAPSSTVKIEVDPKSLTQEQRELVASQLYDGLRFPTSAGFGICPPTYEGIMAVVKYMLADNKRGEIDINTGERRVTYSPDENKKFNELRLSLITAAIAESEKAYQGTGPGAIVNPDSEEALEQKE